MVRDETSKDQEMVDLISLVNSSFPEKKRDMPKDLDQYWPVRGNLIVIDGVVLMNDHVLIPRRFRNEIAQSHLHSNNFRIIIPPLLRKEVLQSLHAAHQGVSGMTERAKVSVY